MSAEFEEQTPAAGDSLDLADVAAGGALPFCRNVAGYTWMGWFRLSAAPTHTNQIFNVEVNSGVNTRFEAQVTATQQLQGFARAPDAGAGQTVLGTVGGVPVDVVNAGPNTHLAIVADYPNDRMDAYINGVLDASAVVAFANAVTDNTDPDEVVYGDNQSGGAGSQRIEDGQLSDCRTYQRAFTAGEIKTAYHMRQHDGMLDDLESRYGFNDGNGGLAITTGNCVDQSQQVSANPQAVWGSPTFRDWNANHRRKVM